jgi:hypothetical protein
MVRSLVAIESLPNDKHHGKKVSENIYIRTL